MPQPASLNTILRVRRLQPTRLEGFVDASFAFTMTLVVISIGHVPSSVAEMLLALRGVPAFFTCFLVIARIWLAHRDWSRHYDLEDRTAVVLSLALVFVVLVYVYPLRMLFAQMFAGLSHGQLNDGSFVALNKTQELSDAYIVFGLGLGAIALLFVLLFAHALSCAQAIGLDADEILLTRMKLQKWLGQLVFALVSIALAIWLPMTGVLTLSLPGMVYSLNSPVGIMLRLRCSRAIARRLDAR